MCPAYVHAYVHNVKNNVFFPMFPRAETRHHVVSNLNFKFEFEKARETVGPVSIALRKYAHRTDCLCNVGSVVCIVPRR